MVLGIFELSSFSFCEEEPHQTGRSYDVHHTLQREKKNEDKNMRNCLRAEKRVCSHIHRFEVRNLQAQSWKAWSEAQKTWKKRADNEIAKFIYPV